MPRRFLSQRAPAPDLPPDPVLIAFGRFLVVVFPLVGIPLVIAGGAIIGAIAALFTLLLFQLDTGLNGNTGSSFIGFLAVGASIGVVGGLVTGGPIFIFRFWWRETLPSLIKVVKRTVCGMALGAFSPTLLFSLVTLISHFTTKDGMELLFYNVFISPVFMVICGYAGGVDSNSPAFSHETS